MNTTELEVFKTLLNLIVLAFTWLVGTRVIHYWEIKMKQKEQNLFSSSEFHKLYGEFTTVWRLWKVQHDHFPVRESLSKESEERYWELLKRASFVEGGMESVLVKLASEKTLSKPERNSLGLFRQAIQQLRQSIRDFDKMNWQRSDKEYILLKELTINTAQLINNSAKPPSIEEAKTQLNDITKVNSKAWKHKIGKPDSTNA